MTSHPHDLPDEELSVALASAERPELLQALVNTSRKFFGVHTRHFPHTINYPWVAARLEQFGPGSSFLEVGPGINPLPLFFAERGVAVDCVDSSDFTRTLPAGEDWNEWGYFDYATLHPRLRSQNVSITQFAPRTAYDAIYSISVIAHMPSKIREQTLDLCRTWLKPGGRLVVSIDLIAGTDTLWNRGGSNETPEQHGTYLDVQRQLENLGFVVDESHVRRNVPQAPVDLFLLAASAPLESDRRT